MNRLLIIAALVAGFLFANTVCIGGLTIPLAADPGEGLGYLVGIAILILSPIAAGLGALASLAVLWLVRQRRPHAKLTVPAMLTGAGIGVTLGFVAARLLTIIVCLDKTLCLP